MGKTGRATSVDFPRTNTANSLWRFPEDEMPNTLLPRRFPDDKMPNTRPPWRFPDDKMPNTRPHWRFRDNEKDVVPFTLWRFRDDEKDVVPFTLYNYHEHTLRYLTRKYCCGLAVVPVFVARPDFFLFIFRDYLFGG